jgi:hypothetical protein
MDAWPWHTTAQLADSKQQQTTLAVCWLDVNLLNINLKFGWKATDKVPCDSKIGSVAANT